MKDKCVLVTGSSSGIGYEITLKLLDLGAKVIGIARNHDKSKLENKNYTTYNCDVSAHQKLEILLKQILKKHPQINCFISNAGYGDFGPLENFSTLQNPYKTFLRIVRGYESEHVNQLKISKNDVVCTLFKQPLSNKNILFGIFNENGEILDLFENY